MHMPLKEAVQLVRACDTKRWTIVAVKREQTVGEHHYRVWVLAMSLYDSLMGGTPHNSFERQGVGEWALVHDADEIWTGDLPSPIKSILEELSPGILKKLKDRVLSEHLPAVAGAMRGIDNTFAAHVVKIAECVETYTYYNTYAYATRHRDEVLKYLNERLWGALSEAIRKYPSVSFGSAGHKWVDDALKELQ